MRWITKTDSRYLEEESEGTLSGKPYYRLGLLGYSPLDRRYEWSTVDDITPMMMMYKGARGSGEGDVVSMNGEFTDPGVLGPAYVGKTIQMRTRIRFESADRHVFEIYFTPPGGREQLADRVVYTRRK